MLSRRTSLHNAAVGATGRSQLLSHAFQASCSGSLPHPGKASHGTGTHRWRPCASGTDAGAGEGAGTGAATRLPGGGGGIATGVLVHPTMLPTMTPHAIHLKGQFMILLLLEALGAGLLLVGIVWWTMFSGRKGGEPASESTKETNSSDR